jgi:cytidine deaminase
LYEKNSSAHICIIHTNKKCISVGINDLYRHAEVDAIRFLIQQGFRSNKKLHFLVFRFSKTGVINCSKPCIRCSQFINKHLHLFRVICFTEKNGDVVSILASEFDVQKFVHVSRRYRKTL